MKKIAVMPYEVQPISQARRGEALFSFAERNFLFGSLGRRDRGVCVSHELRGQKNLSVPPELQDHRLGGGAEQEHREKAHRWTGRKAAHHHRADQRDYKERTKAQRHLALHHPPDPRGGKPLL